MKKIELLKPSDYEIAICRLFSNSSVLTNKNKYSNRNQFNTNKLIDDIYIGKISEILIYNYLKMNGKNVTPVDFMIYNKKYKSYDADLFILNENSINFLHIKSCAENDTFPISWIFEPNDPLVKAPKHNDYLALVVFPKNYEQNAYCYFKNTNNLIYRDAINPKLNKMVIYESDLID